MSKFKVAGTYICTTAHYYNDYKIFYSNTIFYMSLGDIMQLTKIELRHSNNNNRRPSFRFTVKLSLQFLLNIYI